jgi:hypothetical protein
MILASDADQWRPEAVNNLLQRLPISVFGGIFPNIIAGNKCQNRGTVLIGFQQALDGVVVENLTTREEILHLNVHTQCARFSRSNNLLVLVDGLSSNIERFVASLYTLVGSNATVVGGGAGSLDFIPKPCLFSNDGLIQDAAIVIELPFPLHSCVQHGWETLKGPYLVTDAQANILKSLNYKPAYEVYREEVETASNLHFNNDNFFDIAKIYPLGIEDLHGEIIVRDPIRVKNNELVCVGAVPKNAMVYILKGENRKLIDSTRQAATEAYASFKVANNGQAPNTMILDCISRVLFLGSAYPEALQAINATVSNSKCTFGALTLGEIAGVRRGPINLLNKSTIVSLF